MVRFIKKKKDPLASAGDTGSIPDPRRFHMLRSSKAHMPQVEKACAAMKIQPRQK